MERSARADGGGGSGAPGESRADGVDAGADAADQSDARLAGDVGRALPPRRRRAAGGRRCAIGPGRRCRRGAGAARARRARGWRCWTRADRGARYGAAGARGDGRRADECVAPAGAAERAWRRRARRCCSTKGWCGGRSGIGDRSAGCSGSRRRRTTAATSTREQGISRAGNARLQAISIQLAWNWVRWQPHERADAVVSRAIWRGANARGAIGIVAVARKLVIALWRYATTGVVPTGAILKGRVDASLDARLTRAARTVR